MTPAELERRLLDLERRVGGAHGTVTGTPGISTQFGATITTLRDSFPAKITSAYDAEEGYEWERLFLTISSASTVTTSTAAQSGAFAFTPDNDQTIAIGTRGWLVADPTAAGWIFLKNVGGATDCAMLNPGLDTDDCLVMSIVETSGLCSTIDETQVIFLTWDAGDSRWESGATAWTGTGSGGTGPVHFGFTNGQPYLTIDGVYGTPMGCDDGGLLFAFGGAVLCAGGTEVECANYFVVRLECHCCPPSGFTTPGWYCVKASGVDCNTGTKVCVDYSMEYPCTGDVTICSGPYTSQSLCEASCAGAGTGGDSTACSRRLASSLTATLSGGDGTMAMPWHAGLSQYVGSKVLSCGETLYLRYDPVQDTADGLTYSCDGTTFTPASPRGLVGCGPPYTNTGGKCDLNSGLGGCPNVGGCGLITVDLSE